MLSVNLKENTQKAQCVSVSLCNTFISWQHEHKGKIMSRKGVCRKFFRNIKFKTCFGITFVYNHTMMKLNRILLLKIRWQNPPIIVCCSCCSSVWWSHMWYCTSLLMYSSLFVALTNELNHTDIQTWKMKMLKCRGWCNELCMALLTSSVTMINHVFTDTINTVLPRWQML
jgi:hypothetical protein